MDNPATFLTLFLLGFFGGTHCVGMCGGLSSAFALQLPNNINRTILILLLNLGRLSSYMLIGIAVGVLSQLGMLLPHLRPIQLSLMFFANVLLFFTGCYLSGLVAWSARIEVIGKPIWQKINPLLNRLLPIKSFSACFIVGALWGWLPCGLVYNAAVYALSTGSAWRGGFYLLAFGLGTLPNLLAVGLFANQLRDLLQKRIIRFIAGMMVSTWAIIQLIHVFQAA